MKFVDFIEHYDEPNYVDMVGRLNVILRRLGLDNMGGQVLEDIIIAAGQEVEISHSLKVVPKYRIIVRNTGESDILDGDTPWTDKSVFLKNNGASTATLTVLLLRS